MKLMEAGDALKRAWDDLQREPVALLLAPLLMVLLSLVSFGLLTPALVVGVCRVSLKAARREPVTAGDAMHGLSRIWSSLWLVIVLIIPAAISLALLATAASWWFGPLLDIRELSLTCVGAALAIGLLCALNWVLGVFEWVRLADDGAGHKVPLWRLGGRASYLVLFWLLCCTPVTMAVLSLAAWGLHGALIDEPSPLAWVVSAGAAVVATLAAPAWLVTMPLGASMLAHGYDSVRPASAAAASAAEPGGDDATA